MGISKIDMFKEKPKYKEFLLLSLYDAEKSIEINNKWAKGHLRKY